MKWFDFYYVFKTFYVNDMVISLSCIMCTLCVCLVHMETRRGHWVIWNWSSRCLWAAVWVLGIRSGRKTSALTTEKFLVPIYMHIFQIEKIAYSINFTHAQKRKNKGGRCRGRTSCFKVEILFTKNFFFLSSLVDNFTHIYNIVWLLSLLYPLSIAPISVNPLPTTLSFAQINDCLIYGVT